MLLYRACDLEVSNTRYGVQVNSRLQLLAREAGDCFSQREVACMT